MNILASVLPGFRDLRTPLITGYLYLVLLWLLVGSDQLLPDDPSNTFQTRLQELSDQLDRVTQFAAVSVAAYLVGSIFSTLTVAIFTRLSSSSFAEARAFFDVQRWLGDQTAQILTKETSIGRIFNEQALPKDVLERLSDARDSANERWDAKEANVDNVDPADLKDAERDWQRDESSRQAVDLAKVVEQEIQHREFETLVTNLQSDQPAMWNEYDRMTSEADLRFSISLPLLAIAVVAAHQWSVVALLGVSIPIALVVQGLVFRGTARAKVWFALTSNKIQSPTIAQIRSTITP